MSWKRWERGTPMELWQMDVVGGFLLADGRRAKALTGVDDRTLRTEFRTDRIFEDLAHAQEELDAWVVEYNTRRPHSSIGMIPPIERFSCRIEPVRQPYTPTGQDRAAGDWVARRAGSNGVISVSWQQICLGKAAAGHQVDVHVTERVIQVWDGAQLLKTVARASTGDVRKKRASIARDEV